MELVLYGAFYFRNFGNLILEVFLKDVDVANYICTTNVQIFNVKHLLFWAQEKKQI
jgi:hypothetical protein